MLRALPLRLAPLSPGLEAGLRRQLHQQRQA